MHQLIVIDGPDGSGKTTQTRLLADFFAAHNIPAKHLHYPDYSGPVGKLIRDFLHQKYSLPADLQFLLYTADMIKDREDINRWRAQGDVVLLDRYFTSTLAYQGTGGISVDKALAIARLFKLPEPDLIIYLSVSYETAAKRKRKQKKELDRFEKDRDFFERVDRLSRELAQQQIFGKWIIIDGEQSLEAVFADVKQALEID